VLFHEGIDATTIVVSEEIGRVEINGVAIVVHSLLIGFEAGVGIATIVVGIGLLIVTEDGTVIIGDGAAIVAQEGVRVATVIIGSDVGGVKLKHAGKISNGS